jgi:hypothetical protein
MIPRYVIENVTKTTKNLLKQGQCTMEYITEFFNKWWKGIVFLFIAGGLFTSLMSANASHMSTGTSMLTELQQHRIRQEAIMQELHNMTQQQQRMLDELISVQKESCYALHKHSGGDPLACVEQNRRGRRW